MSSSHHFVSASASEISDLLGVSVSVVLSDMSWSFTVVADGGETVTFWVAENPETVRVGVRVSADGECCRSF